MNFIVHMSSRACIKFEEVEEKEGYHFIQWFRGNNFGDTWTLKHKKQSYNFSRQHVMLIIEE